MHLEKKSFSKINKKAVAFYFLLIITITIVVILVLYYDRIRLINTNNEDMSSLSHGPRKESSSEEPRRNTTKYVIFECSNTKPCGGLADRFKGIMNAYAWAKFTNRKLLINITRPCYFHKLMIPNEVDWYHDLDELIENGNLPENYTRIQLENMDNTRFREQLVKMDIRNFKRDFDIISILTNREWFSSFVRNG